MTYHIRISIIAIYILVHRVIYGRSLPTAHSELSNTSVKAVAQLSMHG